MKYMIMLYGAQRDYDAMAGKASADRPAFSDEDLQAMFAFMQAWNQELVESGEFVEAHGLAAPVYTRRLHLEGGAPVVTDGPYAETQEVLAGYNVVECESFDRATELAAKLAKCPYPEGPGQEFIVDIRPIDEGPSDPDA